MLEVIKEELLEVVHEEEIILEVVQEKEVSVLLLLK